MRLPHGSCCATATLILILAAGAATATAVEVDQSWSFLYNRPPANADYAFCVAVADDGSTFMAGITYTSSTGYLPYVIKFAPTGATLWEHVLPIRGIPDGLSDLALDMDGNVIITARSYPVDTWALGIWKLDKDDGTVIWDRHLEGLGDCLPDQYAAAPIAVAPDNSLYVGGCAMTLVKFTPDGTELWRRTLGANTEWFFANDIVVDDSGTAFTVGVEFETIGAYRVAAYDAAGTFLWSDLLVGPIGSLLGPSWLSLDASGDVVVAAVPETSCGLLGLMLTKYSPAGNLLWTASYPENPCTTFNPVGVETLPTGDIAVAGSLGGSADIAIATFDADGDLLWGDTYDGPVGSSDIAQAITSDADGNVYVTGEELLASQDRDYVTLSYDPAGNRRWKISFAGPGGGNDRPLDIAVDDCGNVLVTGYGWNPPLNSDAFLIRYTQVELGDLERDGDVDIADFAILHASAGRPGVSAADGDLDGNGDIDLADADLMDAAWFGPCP